MTCGVDAVEIGRCASLLAHPRWLHRIFTDQEYAYITAIPALALQRCAGRFAAKEAIFKALKNQTTPFLTFCKACEILPDPIGPRVILHGSLSNLNADQIALRITHTSELAIAFVIIAHSN